MAKLKIPSKLTLALFLLIGAYALYYFKKPPFTPDNIQRLTDLFSFNKEEELPLTDPATETVIDPLTGQPKVQLRNPKLAPPKVKTDPKIAQTFAQEMYKQLFLPYDRFPFLYDNTYINGTRNMSGDIRDFPTSNPNGIIMGYRPPIKIGGYDSTTYPYPPFEEFLGGLDQYYGYFPPGGGPSYYDNDYLNIDDLINIGGLNNGNQMQSFSVTTEVDMDKARAMYTVPDQLQIKPKYMTKQERYNRENRGYRVMTPTGRVKTFGEMMKSQKVSV